MDLCQTLWSCAGKVSRSIAALREPMLTTTFFLIRHAAHADLDVRLSGRRPGVPLTAAGTAQAAALGRRLTASGLTRVAASPLDRTMATAQAIVAACGMPPAEPTDALMEIDLGDWTGRGLAEFGDDPAWRRWNEARSTARPPGGESMAEAQARIVGWLQAEAPNGGRVATVTHSDMIRAAVAHVLGLPLDHLLRFDVDPASVTTLVMGDWGARLLNLNVKDH